MTTTGKYPAGTVVRRTAGGLMYRIIEPRGWLRGDSVRTVSLNNGVESTKSIAALDEFYEVALEAGEGYPFNDPRDDVGDVAFDPGRLT